MRLLLAVLAAAVPIPHNALLAIDRQMTGRNYLPTRVVGFTYSGWSHKNGVLRVDFRNKSGLNFEWRVLPMTGSCDAGKQQSFQVGGNKVWWAQNAAMDEAQTYSPIAFSSTRLRRRPSNSA